MEKPHKKLIVWQRAIELCLRVYELTERFPKTELYGLVTQMRRAAVSVPSNIAEGAARPGDRESSQFFVFARASLSELDTQIEIARHLQYLDTHEKETLDALMVEVDRALHGLWKKRQPH